jgi:hypothetical protein
MHFEILFIVPAAVVCIGDEIIVEARYDIADRVPATVKESMEEALMRIVRRSRLWWHTRLPICGKPETCTFKAITRTP